MAEMTPTTPSGPAAVAPPSPLRRLPGSSPTVRSTRFRAGATLWLDGTQLVQENVRGYTQEIQRFALGDIQAIQVRRTVRGLVYNAILLALLALPMLGLASSLNSPSPHSGDRVVWGIFAGFFAVLLLINIARGPTCRTTLTTALGPQVLPSLSRVGTARRALLLIAANVTAVQGALRPDEAAQEVDRARTQMPSAPAPAAGPAFQSYNY